MANNESLINLLRTRGLLEDPRIESAFRNVERHRFLPPTDAEIVYSDRSVLVRLDPSGEATCSATMPSMLAYMLHQLQLQPGMNVLQIGTGVGYLTALIKHILGDSGTFTSLEIERDITEVAQNNLLINGVHGVRLVTVDGADGYAPRAAYDRIVATTGIWDMPRPWFEQLRPNGRIVVPMHLDGLQVSAAFILQADGTLYAEEMMPSAFVHIRGRAAVPQIRKRIGSTALTLIADDIDAIDAAALAALLSEDHEEVQLSEALEQESYWYSFLPYLMLNETEDNIFALYHVLDELHAFGIQGEGFALLAPASACFVPYDGHGFAHHYAGADAVIEVESYLRRWKASGRPGIEDLRLRLIPKDQELPELNNNAKLYARRDHYLHVWLEPHS